MAAPCEAGDSKDNGADRQYFRPKVIPNDDYIRFFIKTTADCDFYFREYEDCKSKDGRKYARFIYGQELDCEPYHMAFKTCEQYMKDGDEKKMQYLVNLEQARSQHRLKGMMGNDVWEYRSEPPARWSQPFQYSTETIRKYEDDNTPYFKQFKEEEERLAREHKQRLERVTNEGVKPEVIEQEERRRKAEADAEAKRQKAKVEEQSLIEQVNNPVIKPEGKRWFGCVIS